MKIMEEIINDLAEAWQTLDATLIIKHLDKSFVYDSQWVFESLDYDGYVDYIRDKFDAIKRHGSEPTVDIVPDRHSEIDKMIRLQQGGNAPAFYRIKVQDGRVVKGDLCMF